MDPLEIIKQLALALMKRYKLEGWTFEFSTAKRRAGRCYYRRKVIELSLYHAQHSELADVLDTIKHEIAHAVTPGAGHGELWQAACLMIGAKPERYYTKPIEIPFKWIATCPGCGNQSKKHRKPKNERSCGRCASHYDPKFKLEYVRAKQ
jgi:predicted SprT family Zn-dependent metalloprotease